MWESNSENQIKLLQPKELPKSKNENGQKASTSVEAALSAFRAARYIYVLCHFFHDASMNSW